MTYSERKGPQSAQPTPVNSGTKSAHDGPVDKSVGTNEGERCGRDGCNGVMGFEPVENCSCHVSAPCARCVDNPLMCLECWAEP